MNSHRVVIWSPYPTHHQSAFFEALRESGIDLTVCYFRRVEPERAALGWEADPALPPGERYVADVGSAIRHCPDWRAALHVVPGYGVPLLMRLALKLSLERVEWLHWSEHSNPGGRSRLRRPVQRLYGRLVNRSALGALAIGALAEREFVAWGIDADRIRFLPYAVPGFPRDTPGADIPARGGLRFLFLGQLIPRKGIDVLLRAMREVHAHHPDARLDLAGNDTLGGTYPRLAAELGIGPAVAFRGAVSARDVGGLLHEADVLVLPARHDGWGVVVNEAASAGLAIIASDAVGAAHHLVVPGRTGFRFPNEDVAALAAAMRHYCAEPALAREHGRAAARLFREEFTPARNAQRFVAAIDSLREARRRAA